MKRTAKQEANIRKGAERMKASKELELLTEAEWSVEEAFEKGSFDLEDRKKLTELKRELNKLWKKQMGKK